MPGPRVAVALVAESMLVEGSLDATTAKSRRLRNRWHPLRAEMAALLRFSEEQRSEVLEAWWSEESVIVGLCTLDALVKGPTDSGKHLACAIGAVDEILAGSPPQPVLLTPENLREGLLFRGNGEGEGESEDDGAPDEN